MDPALEAEILIVVLEKPGGVYTQDFAGLFHNTHGYQLKLSRHGYTSLKSLLNDMKDLVELKDTPNGPIIKCISPKEHKVLYFKGNNTAPQSNHTAPNSSKNDVAAASGVTSDKSKPSLNTFEGGMTMLTCEGEVDKNSTQGLQKVKSTPQESIKQQPSVSSKTAEVNKVAFGLSKNNNIVTQDKLKTEQCSMDKTSHNSAHGLNVEKKFVQKSDQCNLPTVSITEIIPQMLCVYKEGIKRKTLQKRFNEKYNICLEKLSKHLGHKNMHSMIKTIPGIKVIDTNGHLKYILKEYVAPIAQASNMNSARETQMPAPTFTSAIQTKESQQPEGNNSVISTDQEAVKSAATIETSKIPSNHILADSEVIAESEKFTALKNAAQMPSPERPETEVMKTPSKPILVVSKVSTSTTGKCTDDDALCKGPTNPKAQVPNMNSARETQMPAPKFTSAIQTKESQQPEGNNSVISTDKAAIESVATIEMSKIPSNPIMADSEVIAESEKFRALKNAAQMPTLERPETEVMKTPSKPILVVSKVSTSTTGNDEALCKGPTNPKAQVPNMNSATETQMPAPTFTSTIQTKESQQPEGNNSVINTDQAAIKFVSTIETSKIPSNPILADSEVIAESEKFTALKNAAQMPTLERPETEVVKTPLKPMLVVSKVSTSTTGKCTDDEALCKGPTNPKAQLPKMNIVRETQMPAPTFTSAIQTKESQQPDGNNSVTTSGKVTPAHKAEDHIPPVDGALVSKFPEISKPLSVEIKKTPSKPTLVNKKVNTSSTDVKAQTDPAQYVPTAPNKDPRLIKQTNQILLNSQIMPQFNNKGLLPHLTYAQVCNVFPPANGGVVQTQHTVLPTQSIDRSQTKPHPAKKESPPAMSNTAIKKNIKCILDFHAEGITIFNLQKLYIFKFRHPLSSDGFTSMKQFLMTLKDVASVEGLGVQALVYPVSSDEFALSSNNVFTEKSNPATSKKDIFKDRFLRTPKKEILHFAPSGVPTATSLIPTESPNGNELLPIPYISFGSYTPGEHLLKGPSPINPSFKPVATTEKKTKKDSMSNDNVDGIMHKPDEKEWPSLSTNHRLVRQLIQNKTPFVKRQSVSKHSLQDVADSIIEKVDEPKGPPSNSIERPVHSHTVKTVHPTVYDSSKKHITLPNSQTTTTGRMGSLPSQQTLSNISVTEKSAHRTEPPNLFSPDKILERIPQTVSRAPQSLPLPSPKKRNQSNIKQANTKSPSTEADGQVKQLPGKERMSFAIDTSRPNGEHTSDVQDELQQPSDSVSQRNSVAQKAETWQTTEAHCCIL